MHSRNLQGRGSQENAGGLWSNPTAQTQAEVGSTAVALQPPSDVAAVGLSDGHRLVMDGDMG